MEKERIFYRSTNGSPELVNFPYALMRGLAKDNGLYMPDRIPSIPLETIAKMKGMTYAEIAFEVLNPFLKYEIPEADLRRMTAEAYNFPVPLQRVYEEKQLLWLDGGPTLSFKDFAARMMALLMQYYLKKEGKHLVILVATSGDTGSAVANAFYGIENISVVVLFPRDEVTVLQRKQMTTLGGNISAYAILGKFDDGQDLTKKAMADPELISLNLSSANSINIGRLLPQAIQYFYAYAKAVEEIGQQIGFSVPFGNAGHITAGFIAERMGLPVRKLVAATNANAEFPNFLYSGVYVPIVPSIPCISNAMSVGNPSNLPRIIYLEGGMMNEKGKILVMPDMDALRRDFFSVSISEEETRNTIRSVYKKFGIILDPHGAVGWAALVRYTKQVENWNPFISIETANPGKFDVVKEILGVATPIPAALADLIDKNEYYSEISKNYAEFKALLRKKF